MIFVPQDKSVGSDALYESVMEVLASAQLLALATLDLQNSEPNCTNVYFCYDDAPTIYFISKNQSRHSQLIEKCPNVMCSIYRQWEVWGENLHGVQLAGTCSRLSGASAAKALLTYAKRFSTFKIMGEAMHAFMGNSGHASIYQIRLSRGKVLDEARFGKRNQMAFQFKATGTSN
jgi:uncharacterized protein YhbP (UPF0306 family)